MKLLYISGSGRSGSTMLERILHASPDMVALGEFHCLWRLPFDEISCACGTSFAGDTFWTPVLRASGADTSTIKELQRLEHRISRSRFIADHGFSLARLAANADVKSFLTLQFAIFETVARASGKTVLIDSSKAGPRAWLLACDPRVHFIHLYRDPGDVIASWRSRKFDQGLGAEMQRLSVRRAALDWWKAEHFARKLSRTRAVAMVSYAKLCHSPETIVDQALSQAGLETVARPRWISASKVQPAADYHSLNGNPDRFAAGPLTISARATDWSRYSLVDRIGSQGVGGLLSALYPAP